MQNNKYVKHRTKRNCFFFRLTDLTREIQIQDVLPDEQKYLLDHRLL